MKESPIEKDRDLDICCVLGACRKHLDASPTQEDNWNARQYSPLLHSRAGLPFSNQSPPSWEVKPWGSSRSGSHRTVTVVIVRTDGVAET
jgi:hypothetical protein